MPFSESLTEQIPKDSNLLSVFSSFIIFHHQRYLFLFDDLSILAQRCLYIFKLLQLEKGENEEL